MARLGIDKIIAVIPARQPNVAVVGPTLTEAVKILEQQFQDVWNFAQGHPGQPVGNRTPIGEGYFRQYSNGRIYLRPDRGGFHVYGVIGDRYVQLGGPTSWLGWPTSPEQDFAEGGRATAFEHGGIYFWPETGAIELGDVVVSYTGLLCFGETNDGTLSAHDEPYLYFGVVPAEAPASAVLRSRIYGESDDPHGGVDAGDSRIDNIELYRGRPYGLMLSVTLMEHDFGDPEKYRGLVNEAVTKGGHAVAVAVAAVPVVGPFISIAVEAALAEFGDDIVGVVNDALGTEDDFVATSSFPITAKQMVTMARASKQTYKAVSFDIQSPLLEGDGGSYKVCAVVSPISGGQ